METSKQAKEIFHVKRICIVGGGAAGIVALKYLLAEKSFDTIDVLEMRGEVGGLWNYTPLIDPRPLTGHHVDPHVPPELPVSQTPEGRPVFATPMYENLFTNIPKEMMSFSDHKFPEHEELFPKRQVVYDFLVEYAKDVRRHIQFSTQVQDVQLIQHEGRDNWMVTATSLLTKRTSETQYDAVVVASGRHDIPHVPEIRGFSDWATAYPARVANVKDYKSPRCYLGKKVLIIGSGPSGVDVAEQIAQIASEILLSVRSEVFRPGHKAVEVPPVQEFIVQEHAVRFEDGRLEKNIDAVLFCTGYLYSYPFLRSLQPAVTDGMRVLGLYKQLFRSSNPTLVFSAIQSKATPFQISEFQAAAFARVWSRRLLLPVKNEMDKVENMSMMEHPELKFHVLGNLQPSYMKDLWNWCRDAKPQDVGKMPQLWDDRVFWIASNFQALRIAYGENPGATSAEQLGFEFEARNRKEDGGKQ